MMFDFVGLAAGAAALFLLPGYAMLAIARRPLRLDWVEAFCLAVGLSLAAIPLVIYITTGLGIIQGPAVIYALMALFALVIAWDWWPMRHRVVEDDVVAESANQDDASRWWIYAALALVFLFTLFSRLWSVRGVDYPFWTDSYGHAVIAQMIVDQGTIPTTYRPYAEIDAFTYHFGYHTLAAWYHWLTGVPLLKGMVITGQILNALVVPTTYIFTRYFFKSRVAGLVAVIVVGLLSHMPSQFVNWGRFTQLDGQMLLPIALLLYAMLLQQAKGRYRVLMLTVLAFAGLFFVHYRIFLFAAFFVAIWWIWAMVRPSDGQQRGRMVVDSLLLAVLGLLVLAPWLMRLMAGFGANTAKLTVSGYDEKLYGNYYNFAASELFDFGVYGYLWFLAGVGALWGIVRLNKPVMVVVLWMLSCFAGANLHFINLTPLYSNTIVILAIYLPVAALIGYLVDQVARWVGTQSFARFIPQSRLAVGVMLVVVAMGIYAVGHDARLVTFDNIFVRDADVEAMRWVAQETAPDSLFYIAISFWTPEIAHGLEGGYYLPLLVARQTVMPPQHYMSDGSMEYRYFINQRLYALEGAEDIETLYTAMVENGVTNIYIGARATPLAPEKFLQRPDLFPLLYDQAGVRIFGVSNGIQ